MDNLKIIIPHEGVNEIPKGYKPLMTGEGKLVSIVPEQMTNKDVYWIKTERIIPVIDWEQRRYELAKAAMQGYIANSNSVVIQSANSKNIAQWSIEVANTLLEKLHFPNSGNGSEPTSNEKKEVEIGSILYHKGKQYLCVGASTKDEINNCEGCALSEEYPSICCSAESRSDGKNVILRLHENEQ